MNYTEKELEIIEELSGLFFKPEDIAVILERNVEAFAAEIKLETGEAFSRFKKGWLTAEIELRKSVKESAINGSNPAQIIMFNLNKKNNYA